ncbi:MFS transporter [Nocardioides sp. GCM10027113]|uniref:MFS transporter n=1 Tax=unclassified Nocardioides TaxID=2615069 RepID=UPI00361154EE
MSTRPTPTSSGRADGPVLAVLAATQFLLILDAAIVNVALASVGRDLGVSPSGLTWVVNAYVLAFGGLLLLGGRLADHVGARQTFLAGLGVFAAASLTGALAVNPAMLVVARAVQGAGAALAAPAVLALVMTLFAQGPARHRALGLLGAAAGAGGASGLVLGGLLTQTLGWRSVLWINVPVVLVIVAVAVRALPPVARRATHAGFDVAGAVTATAGLSVLVYAVVDAAEAGWTSGRTLALAAAAVLLLAGFVAVESRVARPLVPLGFLRRRATAGPNLVAALGQMAMFPMWFLLALQLQQVHGHGPLVTGLAITPLVAVLVAMNTATPRVLARFGLLAPIVTGLALAGLGLAWFAGLGPDAGYTSWLAPLVVTGLGFGLAYVASIVAATVDVPEDKAGLASGLVNTAQQLGGAVGLALALSVATATAGDAPTVAALSDGYTDGLAVAAGFAFAAAATAYVVLRARRGAAAGSEPDGRQDTVAA